MSVDSQSTPVDVSTHSGSVDNQHSKSTESTAQSTANNKSAQINSNSGRALNGALVALGVVLMLGAAGYWLMTKTSRKRQNTTQPRGQLTPW